MIFSIGSKNAYVLSAQHSLHMLCFRVDRFDGLFDQQTETALRLYQTKYGIAVSGKLNDQTWGSLLSETRTIQIALSKKGYYTGAINGLANNSLMNTLKSFQSANGLTPDGMVGSATRSRLMMGSTSEVSASEFPLSSGSSGDKVLYLQYGLHILCCSPNGIDGSFGANTYSAVKQKID